MYGHWWLGHNDRLKTAWNWSDCGILLCVIYIVLNHMVGDVLLHLGGLTYIPLNWFITPKWEVLPAYSKQYPNCPMYIPFILLRRGQQEPLDLSSAPSTPHPPGPITDFHNNNKKIRRVCSNRETSYRDADHPANKIGALRWYAMRDCCHI